MEHRTPRNAENGVEVVEIRLRSLDQLLASFDPSPFRARNLNREAAQYLLEEFQEIDRDHPAKIVVHLPPDEIVHAAAVSDSIHDHFNWSAHSARRELRRLLRLGRTSLLVGLLAVGGIVGATEAAAGITHGTLAASLLESITIVAWVILWRPTELLLYDWWPIKARIKLYEHLAATTVECRASAAV